MLSKKNLFPIITLAVIGVVVAALLAAVNVITSAKIAENEALAITRSLQTVMPGGEFGDEEPFEEDTPDTVVAIYEEKNGMGSVVILKTQGYASVISITVGVDADGKITKAVVTSEQESHGQAGMKSYTDRFAGLNAGGVASAQTYSGATVTSDAIKNALIDAMYALGYATASGGGSTGGTASSELPKTDEQIKALAESYVGGAVEELTLEEGAPSTLKRLYYHEASGSYVAYNITSTQWVPVETEGFVVINERGAIEKIDMLTWTVGHGVEPQESFVTSFVGKDRYSIVVAELVSGATGTSDNFTIAVKDALVYVTEENLTHRIVGIVIVCLAVVGVGAYVTVCKIRRKRR